MPGREWSKATGLHTVIEHQTDFENPVVTTSGSITYYDGWRNEPAQSTVTVAANGGSDALKVTSTTCAQGVIRIMTVTPGETYDINFNLDLGGGQ